jgi:cytidylate kinase
MTRAPVVTIDGPSGSGKGTIARRLAQQLGWHFLDSGALYRVLGLAVERRGLDPGRRDAVGRLAEKLDVRFQEERIFLGPSDVTEAIRTEAAAALASELAALPEARAGLLARQRSFARAPGLVADGRDMGSVVFPAAEVKIFLTATPEERARRRYKQLKEKGFDGSLTDLAEQIRERDERDRERSVAPLRPAPDALEVESTGLSIEEVLERVLARVRQAVPGLQQ